MSSLLFGVNIAQRALLTYQQALDVTAHNLANANTPGYSRQIVDLSPTTPFTLPSLNRPEIAGQMGSGVEVTAIRRVRDELLDAQINAESGSLGKFEAMQGALQQVESILGGANGDSTLNALRDFFRAFHDLSNSPESPATRAVVQRRAAALTDSLRTDYGRLTDLQSSLNARLTQTVDEVNKIAERIAQFNEQIRQVVAAGDNPNDLLDQRDGLIEKVSRLVNITTVPDTAGQKTVLINGIDLVREGTVNALRTQPDPNQPNLSQIFFTRDGRPAQITNGELGGLLQARDTVIANAVHRLNELASTLAAQFNAVHRRGFTLDGQAGGDFFASGVGAQTIAVSPDVLSDPKRIAASLTSGAAGNGDNARNLAQIENSLLLDGGRETLESFHRTTIVQVGQTLQQAQAQAGAQEAVVGSLNARRQTLSGVSVDEEFINLIRYQRGFEAAARVLTTLDSLMDTLINRTGA